MKETEAEARKMISLMGLENEPDLAEVGLLMYRALIPSSDDKLGMITALKDLRPLWEKAVREDLTLVGTVLDFTVLELAIYGPNSPDGGPVYYDIAASRRLDNPEMEKYRGHAVFVRMANISRFRSVFASRLLHLEQAKLP